MSLLSRLKGTGPSGFGYGATAEQVTADLDLTGRTVLLTGCNSGLGFETLRALCARGARVIATARSVERAEAACASVSGEAQPIACDLAQPDSVRACVAQVEKTEPKLDAVICNAGIMALPRLERAYGYELQFFTNHVGHFLLVTGLLARLSSEGRVVVVSSEAHRRAPREGIDFDNLSGDLGYQPWAAYGRSKLANLLFSTALVERLPESGQTANALHPGVIRTNLVRNMSPLVGAVMRLGEPLGLKTIEQGAATQCYVAVRPEVRSTGAYFKDCNLAEPSRHARDAQLAQRLWQASEEIVAKL